MINPCSKVGLRLLLLAAVGFSGAATQAQVAIPPSYAMPAGSVDTTKPGFRAHPYATDTSQPNSLAWTEDQLTGVYGPNNADLSGADADGYYTVPTVVNWNIASGGQVDNFPPADPFPGLDGITVNMTEEVLAYLEFPTNGVYTMGVNSDDGFRVAAASLNPKDRFSATTLGQFEGGRGFADTIFTFSISQPGIYPFRLLYEQGGGDASVSWFTEPDGTNTVLINDTTTPGAIKSYAKANIAPPYVSKFSHGLSGFSVNITDDASALDPSTLAAKLNGNSVTLSLSKAGKVTTAIYTSPTGLSAGVTNIVDLSFSDNATPAHTNSASLSFVETLFATLPPEVAVPASAVDKTQAGFLYRIHQIDSTANGIFAANANHAEAQLAGLLVDSSGTAYPNVATAGTQPDGSFVVSGVLNFSVDPTLDQGSFTSANNYPEAQFPGLGGTGDNIAGDVTTYLDLKAGLYTFAVSSADGFRVSAASNPNDAFGITLGMWDTRRITAESQFSVKVTQDGIYPIHLVFWGMTTLPNNGASITSLEFYTVNSDGTKTLVNDSTQTNSVKAYWKRTTGVASYVRYAGPASFVSGFANDVASKNVTVILADGTNTVDTSSINLTIDGNKVTPTVNSANGLTRLTLTATNTQIARMVHTASVSWSEVGGNQHTDSWSFNSWRNNVLPAPLYYEDFESTDFGPHPAVPAGWVAVNFTSSNGTPDDPADYGSDYYKGWAVTDASVAQNKDFGISTYAVQELNGVAFTPGPADANPLLQNHFLYAESDSRSGSRPGQIQDVTTKSFDLSGKTGVVLAFDSSYEQNQDNSFSIEYTVDNGATWLPLLYGMQGCPDGQGPTDLFYDSLGNVDVSTTFNTVYGDTALYTDPVSGLPVGGNYGAFVKAPITAALAPFVEGRINDDGGGGGVTGESKRYEVFRVVGADNQASVKFKFHQDGTSSWWWGIDNVGIYSVPSLVVSLPPSFNAPVLTNGNVTISWTGTGTLEESTTVSGGWGTSANQANPQTVTATGNKFYRIKQ